MHNLIERFWKQAVKKDQPPPSKERGLSEKEKRILLFEQSIYPKESKKNFESVKVEFNKKILEKAISSYLNEKSIGKTEISKQNNTEVAKQSLDPIASLSIEMIEGMVQELSLIQSRLKDFEWIHISTNEITQSDFTLINHDSLDNGESEQIASDIHVFNQLEINIKNALNDNVHYNSLALSNIISKLHFTTELLRGAKKNLELKRLKIEDILSVLFLNFSQVVPQVDSHKPYPSTLYSLFNNYLDYLNGSVEKCAFIKATVINNPQFKPKYILQVEEELENNSNTSKNQLSSILKLSHSLSSSFTRLLNIKDTLPEIQKQECNSTLNSIINFQHFIDQAIHEGILTEDEVISRFQKFLDQLGQSVGLTPTLLDLGDNRIEKLSQIFNSIIEEYLFLYKDKHIYQQRLYKATDLLSIINARSQQYHDDRFQLRSFLGNELFEVCSAVRRSQNKMEHIFQSKTMKPLEISQIIFDLANYLAGISHTGIRVDPGASFETQLEIIKKLSLTRITTWDYKIKFQKEKLPLKAGRTGS